MAGISPKLPLSRDYDDGYLMNKSLREVVKQNFKNLLLTSPGERVMDPDFGIGLRNYLFEQNSVILREEVMEAVYEQVNRYLPFVKVKKIDIGSDDSSTTLMVSIIYSIPSIDTQDQISVTSALQNTELESI